MFSWEMDMFENVISEWGGTVISSSILNTEISEWDSITSQKYRLQSSLDQYLYLYQGTVHLFCYTFNIPGYAVFPPTKDILFFQYILWKDRFCIDHIYSKYLPALQQINLFDFKSVQDSYSLSYN